MEIQHFLELSVQQHASDLHILPTLRPMLRINGTLAPIKESEALSPAETQTLIYSFMSEEERQVFEKDLVVEMALTIPGLGNFRVSAFHQLHGIAAIFRVVPEDVPTFEEMDLPIALKSLLGLTQGLILVTGPTGSGKSTTLAAMIEYINSFRACHIITIEDPIEFVYRSKRSVFNQLQVGRDTPDFATALRSSLRQDADVILLGELRDLETMRLALVAAETGHLVMATLHASSAAVAVSHFIEVFPTEEKNRIRSILSETLQAVVCQTLVKRTSGGRVAAFEIMLATTPVRHFIRQDMIAHIESAMQTGNQKGMCTIEQYLQGLVEKQLIHTSTAHNVIANRGVFREMSDKKDK